SPTQGPVGELLMADFPWRSIAGSVWPAIPRGEVSQLWAIFQELRRTQRLDPAQIVDGQLTQVRTLLTHCQQHVPYYQEVMGRSEFNPNELRNLEDFRRFPLLQRHVFQEQFDRFLARGLPAGTQPTTTLRTSGTSGMPIEVRQ